jgi:DNA-directed RNA polymerase specialized sigma24 family protein
MRRTPIQPSLDVADGKPIQPVDPGNAFARQAARVDRLTADGELVDRVMWQGYAGPDWEKFRTALAEYGLAVLRAWIVSGRIFVECKRKGFGAILPRKRAANDDALGLAGETVATALRFFRDQVLIPGRWDMTKGASLNTYFIGACIRHFPNVYLRSDGEEILKHLAVHQRGEEPLAAITDPSPYSRPDRRVELVSAVDSIHDPVVREVLLDEAVGYTQEETAIRLQTTRWAVEGRLRRFRMRAS